MSSAVVILPRVAATAECRSEPGASGVRKGPRGLRLVEPGIGRQPRSQPRSVRGSLPQVAFYRKYTEALLEHAMKLSFEAGRVPSLMGRELFPGNVSHCRVRGFDDVVHLVHDIGNCLETLRPGHQHLLQRIAMQGYSHGETAAMLGISLRTVVRHYARALDELTQLLMDRELLRPLLLSRS